MRKRTPKPNAFRDQLDLAMEVAVAPAPPRERLAFLPRLSPGEVVVLHLELGPEQARELLDEAETESKERANNAPPEVFNSLKPVGKAVTEYEVINRMAADMLGDAWAPNGDAMVIGRDGGIVEGIKVAFAIVRAGVPVRVLVVYGVDPEARFSTDDSLKRKRKNADAFRVPTAPAPGPVTDIARVPPAMRGDVARSLTLRDWVSAEVGHPVLTHLTAATLSGHAEAADALVAQGIPRHVGMLAASCLHEVMPTLATAFLRSWASPVVLPRSAAAGLASSPRRGAVDDWVSFLATVAVAAEAFADGIPGDPYEMRGLSARTPRQLLMVLGGRPGHLPDRLVVCREVEWGDDRLRQLLLLLGRPMEGWSVEERDRLAPLVRDVRRDRGLVLNGQTVKLSDGDVLIDGVDRVAACVIAGVPFRGFASGPFRAGFDHQRPRGRKQSIGHRLHADGYTTPYDIQSVLGNLHRMTEDDRGARTTNTLLRHLHRMHPQVQETVVTIHPLKNLVNLSSVGAAHVAFSRYSRDLADAFVAELNDVWRGHVPATLPRHEVLTLLVEALEHAKRKDVVADDDHVICMILQAMDAWCREVPLRRFAALPTRGFHRLRVPPQVARRQEAALAARRDAG